MIYENAERYIQILKEWIPKEASVAIATGGVYSYYLPGFHDIGIELGNSVQQGDIAKEVSMKKQKVERYIDNANDRAPYYGIGYPIVLEEKEAAVVIILPPTHSNTAKPTLTFLTGKHENRWCPVPIEEIAFIESLQKKTWFYNKDEAYQSIYTLKELEQSLPDQFLRIHRSYIVNIKEITEIARDFSSSILIKLKNGTTLPVSQTYTAQVRKTLGF